MDKISIIALWDVYGGLLTPNRKEIADMYFNLDVTVSEIAEEKGITRQAVSDCLKSCKKQLEGYEEKLKVCKRIDEFSTMFAYVSEWAENFKNAHGEFAQEIAELSGILDKNNIPYLYRRNKKGEF